MNTAKESYPAAAPFRLTEGLLDGTRILWFENTPRTKEKLMSGVAGKNPVSEGEVSTIEIQRGEDDQLNISIVGGADTPLVSSVFSLLRSTFWLAFFFFSC